MSASRMHAIAAARAALSGRSLVDRGAACGHDPDRFGAAGAGAAHGVLDADQVWAAAHVDEDWNIEKWGVDEEVARPPGGPAGRFPRPPPAFSTALKSRQLG